MSKVIICNVDNGKTLKVDTSYPLSKDFKVREFRSRECEVVLYSQRHVDELQAIRNYYDISLSLTNGHRTISHNIDVGGSDDSDHMHGDASDIYMLGIDASDLKIVASKICGWYSSIITYKNTNHVHVSSGVDHQRLYHNGSDYVKVYF